MSGGTPDFRTEEAFGLAIREHRGIIRRISRTYADSPAEREDLEQEIVLQLWRAWPSFAGRALVSTWLYRIALNTAISCLRRKKTRPVFQELQDMPIPPVDGEGEERLERLYVALRKLDEGTRTLLLLWLEDLGYKRIAEITGIGEKAVSVRLTRAKARLRTLVQENSGARGEN